MDLYSWPGDYQRFISADQVLAPLSWQSIVAAVVVVLTGDHSLQCNGASPCDRCSSADLICEFVQRRRSKRVYPPGYVFREELFFLTLQSTWG